MIIFFNLLIHLKGIIFFIKSIPHIIKFNPDIIACHSNLTILQGIFFKAFFNKKFVLHLHELSEVNSIINFKLLNYFSSKAERIYCVSKKMQQELSKKIKNNKIFLTSTGVDPKKFYNLRTTRKKQFIIVGRIQWHKGHKYMIRAMKKISKLYPQYKLIIIGEGEEKNNLLREAEECNVSNYISFHPVISQDDLFQVYNESKLLIMPSLFEGLPKVLLEAFACGLPAVITDECNAEEISKGRALVVKSESSSELSDAVISLLSNSEKWDRFAQECESIIDTHNWDSIASKIHDDYKIILKNE
ncbi:glycosyltransferase family 4 protein [Pelagibacteraceae bacterium]|nr:glycosyltransferase family 4 protein [Pelagibacteraceae bacterium]